MQTQPTSFTSDSQRLETTAVAKNARQAARRGATYRRGKPTAAPVVVQKSTIDADRLPALVAAWVAACDGQGCSPATLSSRRERLGRLVWYVQRERIVQVGTDDLRGFFAYVKHAHENGGVRWDNAEHVKCKQPVKPSRLKAFYSSFRSFFHWLIKEGDLDVSPLAKVSPPIDRPDQITPFSDDQVRDLLAAASQTYAPRRDRAIVLLLLDTGLRAFELCGLTVADVNLDSCHVTVRDGKGGKSRTVPFDRDTRRALFEYLTERGFESKDEPYFLAEWGLRAGDGLTPGGLGQLIERLGKTAKVQGVRCSPHTFRHYAAISFLRAGGNTFTLQQILGHTSLTMTQNYVKIAQADITAQHRAFSPVARLRERRVVRLWRILSHPRR